MFRRLHTLSLALGLTGLASLALVAPAQADSDPAMAGEVLHYDFLDLAHGQVRDLTGNGLDGTIVNGTGARMMAPSLPKHQTSIALHGAEHQYVDVPRLPVLNVDHFTLGAWIRYTGVQNDKTGGRWEVLEKADAYWINIRTDGKVRVGGFFGGCAPTELVPVVWYFLDSAEPVPTGTWTHVASTYDGSTLSVWINGRLSASRPVSGRTCVNGEPLAIGAKNHVTKGLLEAFWDGNLDDVRIFDRAFSADEVAALAAR